MSPTPLVQVGRVILITYGPDVNKLAVIVDIVDHNRVLIDGPTTGVQRQILSFKRLSLTPIVLQKIPRSIGSGALKKKIVDQDMVGQWSATARSKKLSNRTRRTEINDFDRFKVYLLKRKAATLKKKTIKSVSA